MNAQLGSSRAPGGQVSPMGGAYQESQNYHTNPNQLHSNGTIVNGIINSNTNPYNNQTNLIDQNYYEQQSRFYQQQQQQQQHQQSQHQQQQGSEVQNSSANLNQLNVNNSNNTNNNNSSNNCGTNTSHFDNSTSNINNNSGNFILNGQNQLQQHQTNRSYGPPYNRDDLIGNDKNTISSINNNQTNFNMVAVTGNQPNMDMCFNSQVSQSARISST